jgi:hypothetical protein
VSCNDGDVIFFTSKIILTQHSHGTAAAVNHTAAPPHPASPAGIDELRDAGNAEGTAKKVSNMIKICHFLIQKCFSRHSHDIAAAAANQTAATPTCISRILHNRLGAAERAKRMKKR